LDSSDIIDTMNDIEKLKHLLEHWAEHNGEHAETYLEWAKKADLQGRKDLQGILTELAEGTKKLDDLFKKAHRMLSQ